MRIGVDALFEDAVHGTGGVTYLRNVVCEMAKVSPDDQIIVFVENDAMAKLVGSGLPNVEIKHRGSGGNAVARALMQQVGLAYDSWRMKLDVLLSPGNVASLLCPVPVVLVIQNRLQYVGLDRDGYRLQPVGAIRSIYKRILGKLSLHKAKRILAVSTELADHLVRSVGAPAAVIRVVHLGVDLDRFSNAGPRNNPAIGSPSTILNVGRLLPSKNQDTLVRAFALLKRKIDTPCRLMIVGSDFNNQLHALRHLAESLGVQNDVTITGFRSHDEIPQVYATASLYVHPSLVESFGFPVIEAMASGVPVIVSNKTCLPEISGGAGIVVEGTDVQELAAAMARVLTDTDLAGDMVRRGLERAKQLSWKRTARETLVAMREVVKRPVITASRDLRVD